MEGFVNVFGFAIRLWVMQHLVRLNFMDEIRFVRRLWFVQYLGLVVGRWVVHRRRLWFVDGRGGVNNYREWLRFMNGHGFVFWLMKYWWFCAVGGVRLPAMAEQWRKSRKG